MFEYFCIDIMGVDLRVLERIVNYKGRQELDHIQTCMDMGVPFAMYTSSYTSYTCESHASLKEIPHSISAVSTRTWNSKASENGNTSNVGSIKSSSTESMTT